MLQLTIDEIYSAMAEYRDDFQEDAQHLHHLEPRTLTEDMRQLRRNMSSLWRAIWDVGMCMGGVSEEAAGPALSPLPANMDRFWHTLDRLFTFSRFLDQVERSLQELQTERMQLRMPVCLG